MQKLIQMHRKKTSTVSQEGRVAFSGGGSVESKIEKSTLANESVKTEGNKQFDEISLNGLRADDTG